MQTRLRRRLRRCLGKEKRDRRKYDPKYQLHRSWLNELGLMLTLLALEIMKCHRHSVEVLMLHPNEIVLVLVSQQAAKKLELNSYPENFCR